MPWSLGASATFHPCFWPVFFRGCVRCPSQFQCFKSRMLQASVQIDKLLDPWTSWLTSQHLGGFKTCADPLWTRKWWWKNAPLKVRIWPIRNPLKSIFDDYKSLQSPAFRWLTHVDSLFLMLKISPVSLARLGCSTCRKLPVTIAWRKSSWGPRAV